MFLTYWLTHNQAIPRSGTEIFSQQTVKCFSQRTTRQELKQKIENVKNIKNELLSQKDMNKIINEIFMLKLTAMRAMDIFITS